MSRTYRKEPRNNTNLRHPKTSSERRQLKGLKNDLKNFEYSISPKNRINRNIPTSYYDLWASSRSENYFHNK